MVDRNYYLFRSCPNIPLKDDVVGMGWDDLNFCEFDNADEIIRDIVQVRKWNIGRKANQIRRFKAIRKGDVLVVPYRGSTVAIGEAMGEELKNPVYCGQDGSNQQRVRFLRNAAGEIMLLARSNLSEALQKRLKIRIVIADLAEFKDEIDTAFAKLKAGEIYSWTDGVAQKAQSLEDNFRRQLLINIQRGKTNLRSGGIGLEQLVKELLIIDGFAAVVLGKRTFQGSGDADIKASKTDWLGTNEFLIQVKHHDWQTGRWGQEQLLEIRKLMPEQYRDYRLVLVTSGKVSDDDKIFAKENEITILDGDDLVGWIYESIDKLDPKTKAALGISGIPQLLA
jgi:restriction system protein